MYSPGQIPSTNTAAALSERRKEGVPAFRTGDLLLTFGPDLGTTPPVRVGEVNEPARSGRHWRLWLLPTGAGWKGFPLEMGAVPGWDVWLLGEFYGLVGKSPLAEVGPVLAGRQSARRLNGHFLLVAWEHASRTWQVWTDRFGSVHAYYAVMGDTAALGTFSPAVTACLPSRRLDWAGIAGFFGFGYFPQDRTFDESVRVLRPASHYVFDEHGQFVRVARYWEWAYEPDSRRSIDETVEVFASLLEEVLVDHTRQGRIAFPISGGLDSRTTAAVLAHSGLPFPGSPDLWVYSYGYTADSPETRIAAQIAAVRRLPLHRFTIPSYLFSQLTQVVGTIEGFQDVTQCRQASVTDAMAPHADFVIAAHWGDVWLDDMGLADVPPGAVDETVLRRYALKKIQKRGRSWLLENLCRPFLQDAEPDVLFDQFVGEELARIAHITDPDFQIKAFKTEQWSFRWTLASLRMYQPAVFPRLTFYDTRLSDFFCTVPTAFVKGRRLQIEYLKRYAPDLARITWQAADVNLFQLRHAHLRRLPKRIVRKAQRMFLNRPAIQRNWEVQFGGSSGRADLERWLLRPGLRLHELVAPAAVRSLLDTFYAAPDRSNGYTVSMLLTFSAWLERYG